MDENMKKRRLGQLEPREGGGSDLAMPGLTFRIEMESVAGMVREPSFLSERYYNTTPKVMFVFQRVVFI